MIHAFVNDFQAELNMIVTSNRIPVNPEYAAQFEARFKDRAGLVDQMDGFIRFELLRPVRDGDPYIVNTYWESEIHFRAWTESDAFRQQHASGSRRLPPEALTGETKIEIHEITQVVDKAK